MKLVYRGYQISSTKTKNSTRPKISQKTPRRVSYSKHVDSTLFSPNLLHKHDTVVTDVKEFDVQD